MSILDKTADEIKATIGGGYQPNEDETLFLALKSNFSREERIYIFKRLVLTQDQISAIIDITPAQWILDVIAMFEGRLSRSHWFSIVQKARLPTRINDIEFIPADALVFFYFKKLVILTLYSLISSFLFLMILTLSPMLTNLSPMFLPLSPMLLSFL